MLYVLYMLYMLYLLYLLYVLYVLYMLLPATLSCYMPYISLFAPAPLQGRAGPLPEWAALPRDSF